MQPEYSDKFKRKMVQRLSGPNAVSANALSRETGVAQGSLSRWLIAAGTIRGVTDKRKNKAPSTSPFRTTRERTPDEKISLVAEAARLTEAELGGFLRREGLHEADLEAWRESMLGALRPAKSKHGTKSIEARRVRELETEVRRKDKALAEAAALLLLQKKVRDLWGDEDDDTKKENDE